MRSIKSQKPDLVHASQFPPPELDHLELKRQYFVEETGAVAFLYKHKTVPVWLYDVFKPGSMRADFGAGGMRQELRKHMLMRLAEGDFTIK